MPMHGIGMEERIFEYWRLTYWLYFVGLLIGISGLFLVYINETSTIGEKLLLGLLLLGGTIGLEFERRKLLRKPWTIKVFEDRIEGISKRGDRCEIRWEEIGRISRPSWWATFWSDLGVFLIARDGKNKIYIGKTISRYRELAEIVRKKIPHLSHEYL